MSDGSNHELSATVVVITLNRARELERCVRTIFAQTHRPLEVVVVDDGSSDDTPGIVERLGVEAPGDVGFRGVRHDRNRGVGPARNSGIEASTGDVVAFTDDDCEVDPAWVAGLVAPFREDPSIVVTGGAVLDPPVRTWAQRAAEGMHHLGGGERDVSSVNGGNIAIRRSFLSKHRFDPDVRYGADELDLCFTARREGHRVRFVPGARVVHHHRRTIPGFLRQQFRRGRGSVWVRRKHGRGLWPRKNWFSLLLGLSAIGAIVFPGLPSLLILLSCAALFLAMIFGLDASRGKSPATTLATLPLAALGYLFEFAGAASALLGRKSARS